MTFVEKKLRKEIRNGLVAVLYSPGYGAGWSTWNHEIGDQLIFDPSIVYMVEEMHKEPDDKDKVESWFQNIMAYCKVNYPEGYFGGADDLAIEWIPEGTMFKINEYDGNETIEYKENDYWKVA